MKLKLDHFYIAVDEQTFKSHLENPELMKFCNHKVVVADGGDESWEGLYFLSQGEIYFELVKEVPKMNILEGTVGVAISQIAAEEEGVQLQ
ncbi:MAG: hypothetical protein NXH75_12820 [Halobacteriovoraceae bacterium]|nr:hypothetical protein [Halobacteriovoraceae bacterium]